MSTQDYYRSHRSNTPLPSIRDVLPDQFDGSSRPMRHTWPQNGSTLPPISDPRHPRTTGYNTPSSRVGNVSANQSVHGSVSYSFDVFRPTTDGLVHASSSSRSQGILRTTRVDAGRKHNDDDEDVEDYSKKFACVLCGKRFAKPSSLKAHGVVHTEEKPHQCPFPDCGKSFSVASNMRRHYRKIHENYHDSGDDDVDSSLSPYHTPRNY